MMESRRRVTACQICRERRVKCDRIRPVCTQCKKGQRLCNYSDSEPSAVKFVTDSHSVEYGVNAKVVPSSNTWKSVIEHQVNLVAKSTAEVTLSGRFVPLWALAEANEPESSRDAESCIFMSVLGPRFMSTLARLIAGHRARQDRLFNRFVDTVYPILPICHLPTLKRDYSKFCGKLTPDAPVETLVLVLAVLYTGAANSSKTDDIECSNLYYSLYEEVSHIVNLSEYRITSYLFSLQFLQGFVILNTFRASQLVPFSVFGFLPQAIRFAQSLRLHVGRPGNPVEVEIQRRLWWHLLYLDIESTIGTGLQGIIHSDGYTTQLPTLHFEGIMSEPFQPPPMMVAIAGHWQWTRGIQRWFEKMPTEAEIDEFTELINRSLNEVGSGEDSEWPRLYLKMQIDRAYCMLGLRFWQPEHFRSTGCHSEVMNTARSFLQNYVRLSTLSMSHGLSWFIPGFVQPIHALIMILMHLSTCTCLEEESTLSRDILEKTFDLRALRLVRGATNPKGLWIRGLRKPQKSNPRYHSLFTLKERVWNRAGWPLPNYEVRPEENATSDDVDTIPRFESSESTFTVDPMDLIQWDEWDSIA